VSDELRPTAGARYLLERTGGEEDERGAYRAVVFTPDATYAGTAVLAEDGVAEVTIDAPEELAATLAMLAKLTARAAPKRREDGLPLWPARVLRWKGPGR
jgi:hypothetical protein